MTITITWPTAQDREVVNAIRGAIGRDVLFYITASSIPCPDCSLDPVSGDSTDSFCNTCGGEYWIPTYSGVSISGHVTWGHSEFPGLVGGGQLQEGDCRIQIEYTNNNIAVLDQTKWVEVDGRSLQIIKKTLRGVQSINRILIDMIEQEEN